MSDRGLLFVLLVGKRPRRRAFTDSVSLLLLLLLFQLFSWVGALLPKCGVNVLRVHHHQFGCEQNPLLRSTSTSRQNRNAPSLALDFDHDEEKVKSVPHKFLDEFQSAWNTQPGAQVVETFFIESSSTAAVATPFWRDMVAFTWNIQTQEGPKAIAQALDDAGVARARRKCRFECSDRPLPFIEYDDDDGHQAQNKNKNLEVLEFWCDLSLEAIGSGKAHFRLVRHRGSSREEDADGANFKIHTLLTTLLQLTDRPFQTGSNRIRGHEAGAVLQRQYWSERLSFQKEDPFVVIVGGGQAGLALGARLHLLNIPYIILEAGPSPGTAWRKRYPSLHLHDPVWYNHMPYLPFPETWPVFCPRDKIADWMETYAKTLDLNVQTNSRVIKIQELDHVANGKSWQVSYRTTTASVVEDDTAVMGKISTTRSQRTITAKHIVFATGNSSKPRVPNNIPGHFMGLQLHSSQYRGGRSHAGKRVVVVGSNNSAWDIVQDLWEQGAAQVTMIQRSPSMVVSTESVLTHGLGSLYYQDARLHHEDADLVATAVPYKLLIPRWKSITQKMKETDQEMLMNLAEAGYQLDDGPDGAGIFAKSATEGGGFYIDMGCADLVIRKQVHVRYATVLRLEENCLVIQDKTTQKEESLAADVIIYATGFQPLDQWVHQLCGEDVARNIGRNWGLGLGKGPKDPGPWEGELRNMWKPTSVEGLWFHGGNLAQSRHYSRFLGLQLAARYIGIETPVYGVPQATHEGPDNTI